MKSFARAELKRSRPLLGTFVEITLEDDGRDPSFLSSHFEAGFTACEQVQRLMNFYDPGSDLSRLNASIPGDWIEIDPMTGAVLKAALELEEISGAVFSASAKSGARRAFEVEDSGARRLSGAVLDLGGIAKGFAVDLAVQAITDSYANSNGDSKISGIVNAGGDLRVFGPRPHLVQLRAETTHGPVLRTISCSDLSLATSAATRSTGLAARHCLQGSHYISGNTISVLARECIWADALTKVVMMADSMIARRCLERFGAEALVFDCNGSPIEAA